LAVWGTCNVGDEDATAGGDAAIHASVVGKDVYLVLSPPAGGGAGRVRVELDGRPIATDRAGPDVHGGMVHVDRQRLYHLVTAPKGERHRLTLDVSPGVGAYAFTFG
jgi:hypothetical protein